MMHFSGVKHCATDCLSRHPISDPVKLLLPDDVATVASGSADLFVWRNPEDNPHIQLDEVVISTVISSLNALKVRSVTWNRIRSATASEPNIPTLLDLIENDMRGGSSRDA